MLTAIFSLQPILVSRFLVNLRQADVPEGSGAVARFSQFSVPNFRVPTMQTIVGNMGEPHEHGVREDYEEENAMADNADRLATSSSGDDGGAAQRWQWNPHEESKESRVCS